jgi:hypothetical protein
MPEEGGWSAFRKSGSGFAVRARSSFRNLERDAVVARLFPAGVGADLLESSCPDESGVRR